VSGVGGGASGVWLSAGCAARCPFEQPGEIEQSEPMATTARARPIRFIGLLPRPTTFVVPRFETLTHFGVTDSALRRKSLRRKEVLTTPPMVCRLI
jgi:hypothetical protein